MNPDFTETDYADDENRLKNPAPGNSFRAGQRLLRRYKVISLLGSGGVGSVYLCLDTQTGVQYALKSLPAELAKNRSEMGGILENFRLVEKLHHPRIAAIKHLDIDPDSGLYFLVQEYVPGEMLSEIVRKAGGMLPPARALAIARQVAEGLDFAHEASIVHRDIKPANIVVAPKDQIKLVDFGIAGRVQDAMSTITGSDAARQTVSGTAAFMPPEQWMAKAQGPATDQYALAATLYQMLAGVPPFGSGDVASLRLRVIHDEPTRPEHVPPAAWKVLHKALAKTPEKRHASCLAFINALAAAWNLPGEQPAPAKGRRVVMGPKAIMGAAVGFVIALSFVLFLMRDKLHPPANIPHDTAMSQQRPVASLRPNYHALIIGIDKYTEGWEPLSNARADAEAMANVLTGKYGFQVKTLLDQSANRAGIMNALDDIVALGPDDSLLVYYAGHGHYDKDIDEGFLVPSDGRKNARDTWVWNSTLSKILNVSKARHILVVADSCFSGSLFRGGEIDQLGREHQWYKRAYRQPSRYVIASGDLEKVSDGGGEGHSPFARQIIDALNHPVRPVFSASDLGNAIRMRVSELTGQHVRMGGMALSAHGGGEFVFLADANLSADDLALDPSSIAEPPLAPTNTPPRSELAPRTIPSWGDLRDLHELTQTGATNASSKLLAAIATQPGIEQSAIASRLIRDFDTKKDQERRAERQRTMDDLNRLVRERMAKGDAEEEFPEIARPRVLAMLPFKTTPPGASVEMDASFYANTLLAALDDVPGFLVVDRENLDKILEEFGLRLSEISDQRVGFEVGKLLPASLLIAPQLMHRNGKTILNLRLIDTSTSRYIATFISDPHELDALGHIIEKATTLLSDRARRARPLTAPLRIEGTSILAGIGAFHRVEPGMRFDVIPRPTPGAFLIAPPAPIATAHLVTVGESTSLFALDGSANFDNDQWLLREQLDPGDTKP